MTIGLENPKPAVFAACLALLGGCAQGSPTPGIDVGADQGSDNDLGDGKTDYMGESDFAVTLGALETIALEGGPIGGALSVSRSESHDKYQLDTTRYSAELQPGEELAVNVDVPVSGDPGTWLEWATSSLGVLVFYRPVVSERFGNWTPLGIGATPLPDHVLARLAGESTELLGLYAMSRVLGEQDYTFRWTSATVQVTDSFIEVCGEADSDDYEGDDLCNRTVRFDSGPVEVVVLPVIISNWGELVGDHHYELTATCNGGACVAPAMVDTISGETLSPCENLQRRYYDCMPTASYVDVCDQAFARGLAARGLSQTECAPPSQQDREQCDAALADHYYGCFVYNSIVSLNESGDDSMLPGIWGQHRAQCGPAMVEQTTSQTWAGWCGASAGVDGKCMICNTLHLACQNQDRPNCQSQFDDCLATGEYGDDITGRCPVVPQP